MNSMFCICSSLQSLPDISKWDTQNVINMNNMFDGYSCLKSYPKFYKKNNTWNKKK